jgi:hypothetical protein
MQRNSVLHCVAEGDQVGPRLALIEFGGQVKVSTIILELMEGPAVPVSGLSMVDSAAQLAERRDTRLTTQQMVAFESLTA